jgi:hypothetical protein
LFIEEDPDLIRAVANVEKFPAAADVLDRMRNDPLVRLIIRTGDLSGVPLTEGGQTDSVGPGAWTITIDKAKLATFTTSLDAALAHELGHLAFDYLGVQGPYRYMHVANSLKPDEDQGYGEWLGVEYPVNLESEIYAREFGNEYADFANENEQHFDPWSVSSFIDMPGSVPPGTQF